MNIMGEIFESNVAEQTVTSGDHKRLLYLANSRVLNMQEMPIKICYGFRQIIVL